SAQPKPADLVDISAVTNANSVFEVIDIQTRTLQNFDFHEMTSLLEDQRVVVRWIDSDRVMVDVTLSGSESMRMLDIWEIWNREAFLHSAKRQKDFMSLFQFITGTVRSLRVKERDIPKEKTRCSDNPSYFATRSQQ
ncbi:hypothetical protein COOONC_14235, partial [Cooperia oncophora]